MINPRRKNWRRTCFLAGLCALTFTLSVRSQERFRKSPPIPDPLQELRLPLIESATLSNGLTLAVARKASSPLMSLQLVVLAGESDSRPDLPGSASLTANMIGRGTDLLSAGEIEERIESIGGEFAASVSLDVTVFTFNVLEENLDKALEIFSTIVLKGSFPEGQMDTVKRTMYYELFEREKDPEYVAKRQLFRMLFKGHPYQTSIFNEDVIKNVGREDILSFYDRFYRPNNTLLVIAGNMNLSTASRKVSHYFNTWTARRMDRPLLPSPPPNDREQVAFIDLPQAKDATIVLGNVIFPATNSDYFPFIVLNQVLGGTMGSRLFMNLRESKGYASYAFSGADFFKSCGVFWVRAKVTPEVIRDSVQEVLKEIGPSAIEKTSSFEIEQAKSFLIGNFPLKNEPLTSFSLEIARIKAFNLGEDHWNMYYENIILVNLERVLATAQRFLQPRPAIVIVGNKGLVADYLREFDKVDIYDISGNLRSTINKGVEK
jgi:predicted Zn-dependent peptidase